MLIEIDYKIFHWINRDWSHPFLDVFFPFWTDFQKTPAFYVFVACILGYLVYKKLWKNIFIVITCSLGAFLADLINSKILKPFFERPRPVDSILRTAEQGSYSFPSSHAVDAYFIATFLCLFFPKLRKYLFPLVTLTALSRVYCGVHYPSDILAGALTGMVLAYLFSLLIKMIMTKQKYFLTIVATFFFSFSGHSAFEDPTEGKPFFPWLWEDQFKPTLVKSVDKTGLMILAGGGIGAIGVRQYDRKINRHTREGGNVLMGQHEAESFGKLGNGLAGVLIFGTQFYFDQGNGLKTGRAMILTSLSHMGIAGIVQRDRPENKTDFLPYPSSFPSGHTSSAFALAGSMAYSYGWKAGIPAYAIASAIGLSRIKEGRHWASDVVGGAVLGTFWARASFKADEPYNKEAFLIMPMPVYDGMMVSALKEF